MVFLKSPYAYCTCAKDQRREQELDHGGSKAFGRVIDLIFYFSATFSVWPRPLYVCFYYINIKGKAFCLVSKKNTLLHFVSFLSFMKKEGRTTFSSN
jgi:hypothetical protein